MAEVKKKYDPITLHDHEIRALRGEAAYMTPSQKENFLAKCDVLQYRLPFEVSKEGVIELTKKLSGNAEGKPTTGLDVPDQTFFPFEGTL